MSDGQATTRLKLLRERLLPLRDGAEVVERWSKYHPDVFAHSFRGLIETAELDKVARAFAAFVGLRESIARALPKPAELGEADRSSAAASIGALLLLELPQREVLVENLLSGARQNAWRNVTNVFREASQRRDVAILYSLTDFQAARLLDGDLMALTIQATAEAIYERLEPYG